MIIKKKSKIIYPITLSIYHMNFLLRAASNRFIDLISNFGIQLSTFNSEIKRTLIQNFQEFHDSGVLIFHANDLFVQYVIL